MTDMERAQSLESIGSVVFAVLMAVLAIIYYFHDGRGPWGRSSMQTLAQRLGFTLKQDGNALFARAETTGTHRGRELRFFMHENLGEKNRPWMAVAASARLPVGAQLHVAANVWSVRWAWKCAPFSTRWNGSVIAKGWPVNWKALQDLRTGDDHFDAAFFVKTTNPEWAKSLLAPAVRDTLLAARTQVGALVGLRVDAGEARYSIPGNFNRADRVDHLVAQMNFICKVAELAEAPAPRGSSLTSSVAKS